MLPRVSGMERVKPGCHAFLYPGSKGRTIDSIGISIGGDVVSFFKHLFRSAWCSRRWFRLGSSLNVPHRRPAGHYSPSAGDHLYHSSVVFKMVSDHRVVLNRSSVAGRLRCLQCSADANTGVGWTPDGVPRRIKPG